MLSSAMMRWSLDRYLPALGVSGDDGGEVGAAAPDAQQRAVAADAGDGVAGRNDAWNPPMERAGRLLPLKLSLSRVGPAATSPAKGCQEEDRRVWGRRAGG